MDTVVTADTVDTMDTVATVDTAESGTVTANENKGNITKLAERSTD